MSVVVAQLNIVHGDGAGGEIDLRAARQSGECSLGHTVDASAREGSAYGGITTDGGRFGRRPSFLGRLPECRRRRHEH